MPTLLVSTVGGHLVELVDIARRLPDDGDGVQVWATPDHPQSRSLLANEPNVVFVPSVTPRDIAGILRNLPVAHRLMHEWHFTRVISTGSAIAIGYLPYLALRGVPTHYVDSATRIDGDSETAKVLNASHASTCTRSGSTSHRARSTTAARCSTVSRPSTRDDPPPIRQAVGHARNDADAISPTARGAHSRSWVRAASSNGVKALRSRCCGKREPHPWTGSTSTPSR